MIAVNAVTTLTRLTEPLEDLLRALFVETNKHRDRLFGTRKAIQVNSLKMVRVTGFESKLSSSWRLTERRRRFLTSPSKFLDLNKPWSRKNERKKRKKKTDMHDFPVYECTQEQNGSPNLSSIV